MPKKFNANTDVYTHLMQSAAPIEEPTPTEPAEPVEYARINLRLPSIYRDYIQEIAWQNRTNATQYIARLIDADMEKNPNWRDGLDALNYNK